VEVAGPDDCWHWLGSHNPDGYAQKSAHVDGEASVIRWLWKLVAIVPPGMEPDHTCRVRWCVNLRHLELVSKQENMLRGNGFSAVHARKTECDEGHPLSGDNLKLERNGTARRCRECARSRSREYRARRKERVR